MRPTSMGALRLVLALGVAGARPAAAQQPAASSLDTRLRSRVDDASRSRIVALVDSLAESGVARAPLNSKALEGVGKRASGTQIESAVRRLGADLQRARTALGAGAAEVEIEAGADALSIGVAPDVLTKIRAGRGNASALLPLATLTDLVSRGIPVDEAARTVLSLSARHSPDASYREAQQRAVTRERSPAAPGSVPPHAPAGLPAGKGRSPRP